MGKQLKNSSLAVNELVPSMTKNTSSGKELGKNIRRNNMKTDDDWQWKCFRRKMKIKFSARNVNNFSHNLDSDIDENN